MHPSVDLRGTRNRRRARVRPARPGRCRSGWVTGSLPVGYPRTSLRRGRSTPSFDSGRDSYMRLVFVLGLAVLAAVSALAAQVGGAAPSASVSLAPIGTYASGVPFDGDFGAAEIPAYDATTKRLFVVNGQQKQIDVLDISVPSAPSLVGSIELELRPTSVAVHDG